MANLAPLHGVDKFSRTVAAGFGTADSGQSWTNGNSNYAVAVGPGATIFVPASQAQRNILYQTATRTKGEILVRLSWNGDHPLTQHGPSLRVSAGGTSCYYVSIEDYYGEIALRGVDGNGATFEQARTTVSLADHTTYWVRFRIDTQLNVRIWQDGTAEPGTWTLQSALYNGSNPPGAGIPGYYVKGRSSEGGSSYQVSLYDFYYYTTTDDDFTPWPITETFTAPTNYGLGYTDSGHVWSGNFADDPNYYALQAVYIASGGVVAMTKASTNDVYGFLGDVQSGDMECLTKFKFDTTSTAIYQIGLMGTFTASSGLVNWTDGFVCQVTAGSTQFVLSRMLSGSRANLTLSTNTAYTALVANQYYWVRFQKVGSTLQARIWLDGNAEPGTWNAAGTTSGISSGKAFLIRSQTTTATKTLTIDSVVWDAVTGTNSTTPGAITSTAQTDTTLACSASFTGDANANNSLTVRYKIATDDTWSTFGGTKTRGGSAYTFTLTGLVHNTSYNVQAIFADGDGIVGSSTMTGTFSTLFNGTDLTNSKFSITNLTPTTLTLNMFYEHDNNGNATATLDKSIVGSGTFTSVGAMSLVTISGAKNFQKAVTSLTADTSYIFRVTVTDSDGITGTNPQTTTLTTLGKGINPTTVGASVTDITANIVAFYIYDTDNDSSISFQYRAVNDPVFTTVPPTNVAVDRTNKAFITTLFPLLPATTYELHATYADPDGIVAGSSSLAIMLFTTTGVSQSTEKRTKHYQWKVYDSTGNYLGSWPDAGDPSYKMEANGGLSDITVTLPRPLSAINSGINNTVDFENRVDIWAIDGSSDGMGPNLCVDNEMTLGSWVLATSWAIDSNGGPDGSSALKFTSAAATVRTTRSEPIYPFGTSTRITGNFGAIPLVVKLIVRAVSTKAKMYLEAYDASNTLLEQSDTFTETVGSNWQTLRVDYIPPKTVQYVKICIENEGIGTIWADKCTVLTKEYMCYRGRIETFTPKIDAAGETVDVTILGMVSLLSSDYIDFLQYVTVQPTKDSNAGRHNNGPADPGDILKNMIDLAQTQNVKFALYYTSTSIQNTGTPVEYTFRHAEFRQAFDRVRKFAPPDWTYYIEPDGKVIFRGPDVVATHKLRIGVEMSAFSVEKTITNLKNYVYVQGRVDDTFTQPDGNGTVEYTTFDQASINKYGRRYLIIRDASITDPASAKIVGDGRLTEYNREEDRGTATIPDEKTLRYSGGALRGYNIESFRPGDRVFVVDPLTGTVNTYFDQIIFDTDTWDYVNFNPLPQSVPIVSISFKGTEVTLQLSQRAPTQTGSFAKLYRYLQNNDTEKESSS